MKILALTRYGRLGASSRMRTYQYLSRWSALGVDVCVSPLLSDDYLHQLYSNKKIAWSGVFVDYLKQCIKLLTVRKFDLLWIEKELFPNLPSWFEQAISAFGIRYVVDYDDAVFHNYDSSRHPFKRLLANKIDKVMRNSAVVICGNDYLAERARNAGARRVEIVPTVVDLERYACSDAKVRSHLVIGWVGSPTTAKYLQVIVPAFKLLSKEVQVSLRVIGANFTLPNLEIDRRPWIEENEVREIQDFDVGIMPLIDSPWERGKCGYKLIQYMACGKPVIASPVGVNTKIVNHGINGFLATTTEEWVSALRLFLNNKKLRMTMGADGRKTVEEKYCIQRTAPQLVELFKETAARGIV